MSSEGRVLQFSSYDGTPEIQESVPMLWKPFGLEIEHQAFDARGNDYPELLECVGRRIAEYAAENPVDLLGFSNGGKIALSLLIRNPELIRRAAIVVTKIGPYDLHRPGMREAVPNLAATSDVLAADMRGAGGGLFSRVLSLRSREEDVLDDPSDAILDGAHNRELPTNTHAEAIEYVARHCGRVVAQFFRDGIVPESV